MKKRFLSAALAAACAITSLSAMAYADSNEVTELGSGDITSLDGETALTSGTNTVTVSSGVSIPDLKVTIPTAIKYVANPYRLIVDVPDGDGNVKQTQAQIVSPEMKILNKGASKVSVSATLVANTTANGCDSVVSTTGKIDAKSTAKDISIWIEPATKKTVKVNNPDYDASQAVSASNPKQIDQIQWTYTGNYNAKTMPLAVEPSPTVLYGADDVTALDSNLAIAAYNTAVKKMVTAATWATLEVQADSTDATKTVKANKIKVDTSNLTANDASVWAVKTAKVEAVPVTLFVMGPATFTSTEVDLTQVGATDVDSSANYTKTVGSTTYNYLESVDGYVSGTTADTAFYYLPGKSKSDLDALLASSGAIAVANTWLADGGATPTQQAEKVAAAKAAVAAILTTKTKGTKSEATPTENRAKLVGAINSNAAEAWTDADKVALTFTFDIKPVANDVTIKDI